MILYCSASAATTNTTAETEETGTMVEEPLVEPEAVLPTAVSPALLDAKSTDPLVLLHALSKGSRISFFSAMVVPGKVQSSTTIALASSRSAMQSLLSHMALICLSVSTEMFEILPKPTSDVHPFRYELLVKVCSIFWVHFSAHIVVPKARPTMSREVNGVMDVVFWIMIVAGRSKSAC